MFLILQAPYPHGCEETCLVMNEIFLLARYSSFSTETRKVKCCTHICHERLELVEDRRVMISLDHNEVVDSRYFSIHDWYSQAMLASLTLTLMR